MSDRRRELVCLTLVLQGMGRRGATVASDAEIPVGQSAVVDNGPKLRVPPVLAKVAAVIEDDLSAMAMEVYREWNRDRAHWVDVNTRGVLVTVLSEHLVDTVTTIRTQ